MADLIERLRDHYRTDVGMAAETATDIADAAAEIASLRTSLSQEREAREKAERERDRLRENVKQQVHRKDVAGAYRDEFKARAEAAETSLADARRLLKPFADYNAATDPGEWASDDGEIGEQIVGAYRRSIKLGDLRAAARFLAQEPNHER